MELITTDVNLHCALSVYVYAWTQCVQIFGYVLGGYQKDVSF